MKHMRRTKLVLTLLIFMLALPFYTVYGQTKDELAQSVQSAEAERKAAYLSMAFETGGWQAGTVIAKQPYSVVINDGSQNTEAAAFQVQIWRGTAARVVNNLLTDWDLLVIDPAGKVVEVIFNVQHSIIDYFKASSQDEFKAIAYADSYPWANLPTDLEAKAAGMAKITDDGTIDVYQVLPLDGSHDVSIHSSDVRQLYNVPSLLAEQPKKTVVRNVFSNVEIVNPPADIRSHWAQSYILDMMGKSIIVGYPDLSIKPDRVLTKAEFTKMFVIALRLNSVTTTSNYSDIHGHWAEQQVNTAVDAGLIKDDTSLFLPNSKITRLETARMLGIALQTESIAMDQTALPNPVLNDLQELSVEDTTVITALASQGIINGDPDGKFRPNDSLTRAEACKVISAFLQLEKGEKQ